MVFACLDDRYLLIPQCNDVIVGVGIFADVNDIVVNAALVQLTVGCGALHAVRLAVNGDGHDCPFKKLHV